MLDNKSLVSSANYLTDLNSMYAKNISIEKNNMFIPNGIQHTIEATIGVFDRVTNTDGIINILEATTISSNAELIAQIQNIANAIDSSIIDATVTNTSGAVEADVGLSIFIQTDTTILKTLNIKVKYGSVVKYDIDSTSDDYIQILTAAGMLKNNDVDNIGIVSNNIENITIASDNILDISTVASDIVDINTVSWSIDSVNTVSASIGSVNTVNNNISSVNTASGNISSINTSASNILYINIVATDVANVNTVSSNILDVNTTATNMLDINTVSSNIYDINTVSADILNVNTNALNIADINIVSNDIVNVNTVSTNISDVNIVSSNISDINSVQLNIVPNLSEILDADSNAQIATAKAGEALDSQLLAERWASEPEDIIVANGKYSAYHYMLKAEEFADASISVINDEEVKTVQTYSSSKIETDLNVIGFDLNADVSVGPGQIAWNATEGTYDMGLENGSVLQVGQENIRKVTNNSGALIPDGRLVMYNGTNGSSGRINVKPFTAGFDEAIKLYGVATQSIANNGDGIITIEGKVRGLDTTGASVGEVWADNDILYAKPNDNGMMTKIAPADDELKIVVASVIKAHHNNGTLEIRFMPFNENAYYTKVQSDILLNEHTSRNDNPHGVTKYQVGLGNANNTSDVDKPVSNATQTALNLKSDKAGKLSQFASTTSSELAGVISDETGSGKLVFAISPVLITPNIGVASGTSFNGITGLSSAAPIVAGIATIGTSTTVAKADHIHPAQTSVSGNAGTATKLATSRNISLIGDIFGTVSFDGASDVEISATVLDNSHNHTSSNISDATNLNTSNMIVKRDASGNFSAGTITATLSGNSSSATKLATARNIALSGDITGSANFDGSGDITIASTIAANSVALGTDTTGNYVAGVTAGTGIAVTGTAGEGWSPTVALGTVGIAGTYRSVTTDAYGRVTAGTNPTTVTGYGLTDVYTKTQVDTNIGTVAEFNATINF